MFLKQYFYHEHIRKAIIAFGTIFNQITVKRRNQAGEWVQSIHVPLSYSPKQKFLARIAAQPTVGVIPRAITLPRIGFEIANIQYDATRKLPLTTQIRHTDVANPDTLKTTYTSTPYNLDINLFIMAKNQDDGLQILEQIIPFFNPDFNITIKDLPEMNAKRDIMIVLNNIRYEDVYEGGYTQRRTLMWDLAFTMKLNFFGLVSNQNIIKKSFANIFTDAEMVNNAVWKYNVRPEPQTANRDDEWTYVEEFDESGE